MTQRTVYISGPMTGKALFNFPAFFRAAQELRKLGYAVLNPAERDMAMGVDPSKPTLVEQGIQISLLLRQDFADILSADGVCFLPGWEKSTGAKAERLVAFYAGVPCYKIDDAGQLVLDNDFEPRLEWVCLGSNLA